MFVENVLTLTILSPSGAKCVSPPTEEKKCKNRGSESQTTEEKITNPKMWSFYSAEVSTSCRNSSMLGISIEMSSNSDN